MANLVSKRMQLKKYHAIDLDIYEAGLELRNKILRIPLGKSLYDENLSIEKENDFYGLFLENVLSATLGIFEESPIIAHLTSFAVEEKVQQMGVGSALLNFVENDLVKMGFKEIEVSARQTALGFYQKMGFEVSDGPIWNEDLEIWDFLMFKKLKDI